MNQRKKTFAQFLFSKGMYIAFAVCLAGAGTAAWISMDHRLSGNDPFSDNLNPSLNETLPETQTPAPSVETNPSPALEKQWSPSENAEKITAVEQKQAAVSKEAVNKTDDGSVSSPSVSSSADTTVSSTLSESFIQLETSSTLSFELPLNTSVLAPFSGDELVENKTLKEWRTHNGIDLKAQVGDQVKAACDGKIVAISLDPLWGTSVEVQNQDYTFTYCGLSDSLSVKLNDQIAKGEPIGFISDIPCEAADGSHLHFTVRQNDEYIDPFSLLPE